MSAPAAHICATCGTQFPPTPEPPAACAICLDPRQYVAEGGQQWTTPAALRAAYSCEIEEVEPQLTGIGMTPRFAIGQRALLLGGLLWDCISLLDDTIATAVEAKGGIRTIAVSHPHYYASMIEWAERFDARVLLHEADRRWVMRPDPRIEFWSGERLAVTDGVELLRLGGHFPGGTIVHWRDGAAGRGALLTGDIVQVVADHDWVSFMWSYPNLIPLPATEVERIAGILSTLEFDRIYGAWWETVVHDDAKTKVARSAARYVDALAVNRATR